MSAFWKDVMSVYETALQAPAGAGDGDLNILVDGGGALRIVAGEGWRPEALQAHYGAKAVYQVSRGAGKVRVDGRCLGERCVLESVTANHRLW